MKAIDVSAELAHTPERADGIVAMAEATLCGNAAERSPTDAIVRIDADC